MSDTTISKTYVVEKTTSNNVMMVIHPVSNPELSKEIYLTARMPKQTLPLDWALGIFVDEGLFNLYKNGVITFNDNNNIIEDAKKAGVYFGETNDIKPAEPNRVEIILTALKSGNRQSILDTIAKYGKDTVKDVVISNVESLTQGVISMLEDIFKFKFTVE
jgi:hypothetical protein